MSAAALGAIYQLGLLLLMFAAGAEMRRLLQRDAARTVGLIAGFGMVLPFAAGLGLVAVLGVREFIGPAGNHTALILVFGMAVAVTSIPVISRIMHDVNLLSTRFARMVLSAAVVEDIVLYVVLAGAHSPQARRPSASGPGGRRRGTRRARHGLAARRSGQRGTVPFLSFQQRKPPGLEQRHDGVDPGLRCGVVRVRPQHGSGVVQAVQLGRGFSHAAT
jgi:hypothetical protein